MKACPPLLLDRLFAASVIWKKQIEMVAVLSLFYHILRACVTESWCELQSGYVPYHQYLRHASTETDVIYNIVPHSVARLSIDCD